MKRLALFSLMQLFVVMLYPQDIEVKKFEPMAKDQTATLSPKKDINGTVCGMVKVALKELGAKFKDRM